MHTPVSSKASPSRTKSRQIYLALKQRIMAEPPGTSISTEQGLSKEFDVCRATINKVLKNLEGEGLLVSRQGVGRFVAKRTEANTGFVAVLIESLSLLHHPVMAIQLKGITQVLEEAGQHLRIFACTRLDDHQAISAQLADFLRGASGAIITSYLFPDDVIDSFRGLLPISWIDHPPGRQGLFGSRSDYLGAGFIAGRKLLERGHRRVLVCVPELSISFCREACDGLRLALQSSPGGGEMEILEVGAFEAGATQAALEKYLAGAGPCFSSDAIVATSQEIGAGAFHALQASGRQVPRDCSILSLGCHGAPAIQLPGTTLASINLDLEETSARATRQLLDAIAGRAISQYERDLPLPRFVDGGSLAENPGRLTSRRAGKRGE